MPIYEYHCRSCGEDFETPACVHCSGTELEKKLSVFSAQSAQPAPAIGSCGTCGNPAGPGSCRLSLDS